MLPLAYLIRGALLWKVGKWDRRLDWKKCKFFITMALFLVASCGILK